MLMRTIMTLVFCGLLYTQGLSQETQPFDLEKFTRLAKTVPALIAWTDDYYQDSTTVAFATTVPGKVTIIICIDEGEEPTAEHCLAVYDGEPPLATPRFKNFALDRQVNYKIYFYHKGVGKFIDLPVHHAGYRL
jgi:hypothetical protein